MVSGGWEETRLGNGWEDEAWELLGIVGGPFFLGLVPGFLPDG